MKRKSKITREEQRNITNFVNKMMIPKTEEVMDKAIKSNMPKYVMQIYAKSKALSVEPYNGDKDCERYITVDEAIRICDEAVQQSNSR